MAAKVLLAVTIPGCLGDWVRVQVRSGTGPQPGGGVFDGYLDESSCAVVHNLTMMSYGNRIEPSDEESCSRGGEEDPKSFLNRLKDKLERRIGDRISDVGGGRRGRTHHIGFPSLEGALLSISLLIFAVFLIKLVLKLMHTLSYRKNNTDFVNFLTGMRHPVPYAIHRKGSLEEELKEWRIVDFARAPHHLFRMHS